MTPPQQFEHDLMDLAAKMEKARQETIHCHRMLFASSRLRKSVGYKNLAANARKIATIYTKMQKVCEVAEATGITVDYSK